jgi:cytoskeletal protein CcmA (bactofilin family)
MPNSKIPNLSGDISSLTRSGGSLVAGLNSLDSDIGIVSDSNLGTTASTIVGAIGELDGRLDSINENEIRTPKITTTDSTDTSVFKGGLTVEKDLLVNGDLTVDGIATIKAGANNNINLGDGSRDSDTVTFNAEVASHLVPDADATYDLGDSAKEWRNAYFDGTVTTDNLKVDDSATITNNLTVTGVTTVDSINVSHLSVSDSTNIDGVLTVSAATTFVNPVTYNSSISFADSATVEGNLTVNGTSSFTNDVTVTADLTIDSNLDVKGLTTLDSTDIAGFLDVVGSVNVTENLTVGGQFTISGTASTTARYYEVLKDQVNLTSNRGGLSVYRETEDSALLQWNEAGDFWEAGPLDSLNRLALQNDSAIFSRIVASGTGALRVPRGTTSQRPSDSASASVNGFAVQGDIRYNSSTSSFEGYSGTSWGSLGGLIDVDQDTQIIAEIASGTDSDTLQFYTGGTLAASLDSNTLSLHTPDLKVFYSNDSATTISGGTITTQKVTMDSGQIGKLVVDTSVLGGGIRSLDGGTIYIAADSGAEGIPHIQLQSLNGAFNEGKITLLAAGDIRLDAINNDIILDGTKVFLGPDTSVPSSVRGIVHIPDTEGGYITSINADDSAYITYGPVIDFYHTRGAAYGEGSFLKLYADSVHVRRAGLYVEDALNQGSKFDGDVTVVGNLTVEGTTTSVSSTQVELGDRIIELNSEIDSAANPTQDAGIEINRGAEANAQLLFDESENYWVAGEGDSNTKARIVTTNYLKFPGNDALSLDSATGTISHTGRNVPTIDVSGGVKGINAVFDSNGHVTSFTVTEGGGLTTQSGSGLAISGANDSDISIDSASLRDYYLEQINFDAATSGAYGSTQKFRISYDDISGNKDFMEIYHFPAQTGQSDEMVVRSEVGTGLRIQAGGTDDPTSGRVNTFTGGDDVSIGGDTVGIRSNDQIFLIPGYDAANAGTQYSSGKVIITSGENIDATSSQNGNETIPGYGTTKQNDDAGSISLIPGTGGEATIGADNDLVLRNLSTAGSTSSIYYVSKDGDHHFRKSTTGDLGDADPELIISTHDTTYGGAGPSGQGHTVFYTEDSATFSIGSPGNFTIKNSVSHSHDYIMSLNDIGKPNGATLVLHGDEGSPLAGNQGGIMGEIRFAAENSSSEDVTYAAIIGRTHNTANGGEEGTIDILVRDGSTMDNGISIREDRVRIGGTLSYDRRTDIDVEINGNIVYDAAGPTNSLEVGGFTTTFNLIDTNATTINFGGAATTIDIGATTGTTTVKNDLDVDGDLYAAGTIQGTMAYSNLTGTPTIPGDTNFRAAQHVSGGYIGAVGQYRLARWFATSRAGSAPNTTAGGSNLGPADVAGNAYKSSGAYVVLGGSWRQMGYQHSNGSLSTGAVAAATTLWVRYA